MKNCIDKSVCHQTKFSTVDLQSIFLIKYQHCVMENSLQKLSQCCKKCFTATICCIPP